MNRNGSNENVKRSLLAITQTAVGCGIGLLIAGKLERPTQKTTAATLLGIGALLALPAVIDAVTDIITGPGSKLGERRRLDSIRRDSGFPDETEIF